MKDPGCLQDDVASGAHEETRASLPYSKPTVTRGPRLTDFTADPGPPGSNITM
jgi:hypothetical protein